MKRLSISVRGQVTFSDDEWLSIERAAKASGVGPLRYLREETSLWWNDWNVDEIEVDET